MSFITETIRPHFPEENSQGKYILSDNVYSWIMINLVHVWDNRWYT